MSKIKIVCVKYGDKYPAYYVNRLRNMTARHLNYDHEFICFTDDIRGIQSSITIREIGQEPLEGWWWKTYLFKPDLFEAGSTILFFDLDMVVVRCIDKLIDHEPHRFLGLRDVGRVFRPDRNNLGSAVMRWTAGQYTNIWTELAKDFSITSRYRGDQDWIWHLYKKHIVFYPDPWIRSYKWEVRTRKELVGRKAETRFREIRNPDLESETCVLAFHGYPKLDLVHDPIILKNWQ